MDTRGWSRSEAGLDSSHDKENASRSLAKGDTGTGKPPLSASARVPLAQKQVKKNPPPKHNASVVLGSKSDHAGTSIASALGPRDRIGAVGSSTGSQVDMNAFRPGSKRASRTLSAYPRPHRPIDFSNLEPELISPMPAPLPDDEIYPEFTGRVFPPHFQRIYDSYLAVSSSLTLDNLPDLPVEF